MAKQKAKVCQLPGTARGIEVRSATMEEFMQARKKQAAKGGGGPAFRPVGRIRNPNKITKKF
jgi:hypothetical protein